MNPILDASRGRGRTVTGAFFALAMWYAAHRAVRRVWAFSEGQTLRVVVMLEPTRDGDDISPIWLANSSIWAHDLQTRLNTPVQLEATDEPLIADSSIDGVDSLVVADLSWRDPAMLLHAA